MIYSKSTTSILSTLAFLLCLLPSTSLLASSIERFKRVAIPSGTTLGLVSADSIQNGTSTSIATYRSTLSLNDTLAFYKDAWPNEPDSQLPGRLESIVGDWLLISRLRDGVNTVIQLKLSEKSRSHGFLSIKSVDSSHQPTRDMQRQSDYVELSRTLTADGPLSSTVLVLQSHQSMSLFIESMLRQRSEMGWNLSSQKQYEGSHILLMNKQLHRAELVFSPGDQGQTLAVINEVRYEGK